MKFSDLNLIPPILKAAAEAGYEEPSPIQQKAIPPVLAGRDLLGCAQTGTGKTAAFAMPILQRLAAAPAPSGGRPIRALILTPTRELALQIDESFAAYGRHMRLAHCVIFGGVNQNPQVARLKKGVDILTATPDRLNDLIGQGYIDLKNVEIFVLDEADRMLDMGFVHDVKRVLACLPGQKQTLLFSATMPREIEELAEHSAVCVPTMMPYITAFFMPRAKGDRPDVIPDGCTNFAFLGQFAETPRDTIFTTEYSVRTAMEAVYGLLGVDRGVPEVWGSVYDVRDLLDSSVKLMDGKSPLEIELPGLLNLVKKPLLKVVKGTVVEDLLKEHGILKDYMLK